MYYFVGVANYTRFSWDWLGPFTGNTQLSLNHAASEFEVELTPLADAPVRTILTQPDKTISDELGTLPDNAKIAGFIPHTPILKRSSIVVNHAGHGIVSKAIRHGEGARGVAA